MSVQVREEAAKERRADVLLVIKIYWNDAVVYHWHHRGDNKAAGNRQMLRESKHGMTVG